MASLLLAACGGAADDPPAAPPPPALAGVYAGTFPCEDCPGIATRLWLRPDGRFFIHQHYAADEGREAIDAYGLGRWRPVQNDDALMLESGGPNRIFRRDGPDALLLKTDSPLEHRLLRDREATDFTSELRLSGTVRMQADGPVFAECATGYAVPVRQAGDFGRFRHQYRSVRAQGGPVFVEFRGRFHWAGGGAPQSVTIDRFETIRENGAC